MLKTQERGKCHKKKAIEFKETSEGIRKAILGKWLARRQEKKRRIPTHLCAGNLRCWIMVNLVYKRKKKDKDTHTHSKPDWIYKRILPEGSRIKSCMKNLEVGVVTPVCFTTSSPRKLISCWIVLFKKPDGSVPHKVNNGKTQELQHLTQPKAGQT